MGGCLFICSINWGILPAAFSAVPLQDLSFPFHNFVHFRTVSRDKSHTPCLLHLVLLNQLELRVGVKSNHADSSWTYIFYYKTFKEMNGLKLTVRKKLFGGFFSVLLILFALAAFSYYEINAIDDNYTYLIEDKANKLVLIKDLELAAKGEHTTFRGYLIMGTEESLQAYNQSVENYKKKSEHLEDLIKLPKAKALLSEINAIEGEYRQFALDVIPMKKADKTEEYTEMISSQGRFIVDRFSKKAEELSEYQKGVLNEGNSANSEKVDFIKNTMVVISMVSVLIAAIIAWISGQMISKPLISLTKSAEKLAEGDLSEKVIEVKSKDEIGALTLSFNKMTSNLRGIIHQVKDSAEHVTATAEELSASAEETSKTSEQITYSIQEVAAGVDKEFKSVEETSQTINETAAGIQQVAASAQTVASKAFEASERAAEGEKSISTAVKQMDSINHTVHDLAQVIGSLGNRSKEISKIIDVITGISAQTNLLALNAAIEAARAGEHGRGFSVVADEVRKLAEQSAASAQQISELVVSIQGETEKAVKSMDGATAEVLSGIQMMNLAGESFTGIEDSVNQVSRQIHEVSAAIEQMAAGSEQMVASMKYISEIGEASASHAQEVTASSEEQLATIQEITSSAVSLSHMAEGLQDLTRKFKL